MLDMPHARLPVRTPGHPPVRDEACWVKNVDPVIWKPPRHIQCPLQKPDIVPEILVRCEVFIKNALTVAKGPGARNPHPLVHPNLDQPWNGHASRSHPKLSALLGDTRRIVAVKLVDGFIEPGRKLRDGLDA